MKNSHQSRHEINITFLSDQSYLLINTLQKVRMTCFMWPVQELPRASVTADKLFLLSFCNMSSLKLLTLVSSFKSFDPLISEGEEYLIRLFNCWWYSSDILMIPICLVGLSTHEVVPATPYLRDTVAVLIAGVCCYTCRRIPQNHGP